MYKNKSCNYNMYNKSNINEYLLFFSVLMHTYTMLILMNIMMFCFAKYDACDFIYINQLYIKFFLSRAYAGCLCIM